MNKINNRPPSSSHYRSDIQVLRGIAVLAVVLYHLRFPVHGGSLGVDAFFVISGFVITETLLRSSGTITARIKVFYQRRIRRIFPASIYVTCITLLSTFLFLPRIYSKSFIIDAISALFMVANLRFAQSGVNYLQETLHSSPFLHLWSLGVEEQFYLLWPILLMTIFRRKVLYYLAVPTLFLISVITTQIYPTISFFAPTSRAWEFMIGAYIATLPKYEIKASYKVLIQISSTLILFASLILLNPTPNTFTLTALPLVLAIGALIFVGFSHPLLRPIEYVGGISFSLYLLHWPVIAILLFYSPTIDRGLALIIFLASLVTAKFVTENIENPIRFRQKYLKSRKFWITLFVPVLGMFIFAFAQGFSLTQKLPLHLDTSVPVIYKDGCHATKVTIPKETGCDFGKLDSRKLLMLVGDSHAAQWFPGFQKVALADGLKLRVATESSCPALSPPNDSNSSNSICRSWETNLLGYINASKPGIVVISSFTEGKTATFTRFNLTPEQYVKALRRFIALINPVSKVVVIGDTPDVQVDSVTCLSLNWKNTTKCDLKNTKSLATQMTGKVQNFRTTYIDSRLFFCTGRICPAVINGKNVYRDGSHISGATVDIQALLAKRALSSLK